MLKLVHDGSESAVPGGSAAGSLLLDEIVRDGARRMLAAALQAGVAATPAGSAGSPRSTASEVTAYVDQFVDEVDENGHRLVVRNGYHEPREVVTAAGAVPVRQPRVNDRRIDPETGERARFASSILPAWARKSPGVAEVLPLLCLHGLSSQDFGPALEQFLGSAQGLSAATITRLTTEWQTEAKAFNQRSLAGRTTCTCGPTGSTSRSGSPRTRCACWSSSVSARMAPRSWSRSMTATASPPSPGPICSAPASAAACALRCSRSVTARSASGPRCATCSPRPENSAAGSTRSPTCSTPCPSQLNPGAKTALAEIWNAEDRDHVQTAARTFADTYGAKWPKAAAKITDDLDVLLAFYDYPAEHWIHLRTTNPIESTFATVRLRQRVTKGPGSRAAGSAMAFKLIESAQRRGRAVNAPHLVALVRAGAHFDKGRIVERPDDQPDHESGDDAQAA